METTPLKIIAVGNAFYGDDGIGMAVLEQLKNMSGMKKIPLINGATDALGLIDHFEDSEHVIIIDAARMGCRPGTVRAFNGSSASLEIIEDHLSFHGLGLSDAIQLATELQRLPERLSIVGVEPEQLTISCGLSEKVRNAIPEVIETIFALIKNKKK